MSKEFVEHQCACGKLLGAKVEHYDQVKCGECNRVWWALRPLRCGPLAVFPWPGLPERVNRHRATFDFLRGQPGGGAGEQALELERENFPDGKQKKRPAAITPPGR